LLVGEGEPLGLPIDCEGRDDFPSVGRRRNTMFGVEDDKTGLVRARCWLGDDIGVVWGELAEGLLTLGCPDRAALDRHGVRVFVGDDGGDDSGDPSGDPSGDELVSIVSSASVWLSNLSLSSINPRVRQT